MPTPVATYLNDVFTKAGIPADHQGLKDLLTNAELSKINLPDDLVSESWKGLHTTASALSNADIKKALFKQALNGVEAEVEDVLKEDTFDDNLRSQFKGEQNTFKKIKMLAQAIKQAESAKSGAAKGDKAEFQKEINELKAQLSAATKKAQEDITSLESKRISDLNDMSIDMVLARYNYALGEIDPEVKVLTARGLLNKALAESGAKIVNDPANPKLLKLQTADGTDFYDDKKNKKDVKSFIEGVIAPILSTTEPAKPVGNTSPTHTVPGTQSKINHSALSKLDAEIAQASQVQ